MRPRLLLIDDDPGVSEVLGMLLEREGYQLERAGEVKSGLERARARDFDLVITDLRLPDGTGLDVVKTLRAARPELPVIMITSYSSMESAIAALRGGAVDYIIKPFDNEELLHSIARALNERRIARENSLLKRSVKSAYAARPIIGESPEIRRALELVRKSARSDAPVLLYGESGTGKELAAAALHYGGPCAEGPFVVANAREALELVREAQGGSLFLEEVSELPAAMQTRLVRVLEKTPVDVRFIAATQRELAPAVERGEFRRDLYYRLSVISVSLPPLRERGADRELLARHFAERYAKRLGKRISGFDTEFTAFIENHPWPGNVRELENLIERAAILAEGEVLTGRDLAEVAPALPMVRATVPLSGGARPLAIEEYIREVIERYQDSHSETELARMLGIGRKALWMRRRQWGLRRSRKTVSR
jgi:DNA-binding NtrC family response regulator